MLSLFPSSVVVETANEEMWWKPATVAEEEIVRNAIDKRKREFRAGRACARRALQTLGFHNVSLLVGTLGSPVWPQGSIGSITHCSNQCAAAVARVGPLTGLGIDIELRRAVDVALLEIICRPDEIEWISQSDCLATEDWLSMFFSAKESVYKCLCPIAQKFIDFQDVKVVPDFATSRFWIAIEQRVGSISRFGRGLEGRFALTEQHIYTSAYLWAN